jgi:O-antigen/teichoic acid export membrane protein
MPLLLAKRTPPLLWINLLALGFCVGCNLLLIPRLGILGAALSTTSTFAFLALLVMLATRTVAAVPFELRRLATVVAVVLASCLVVGRIDALDPYAGPGRVLSVLGGKTLLTLAGLLVLWRGVLHPAEREAVAGALRERLPWRSKTP